MLSLASVPLPLAAGAVFAQGPVAPNAVTTEVARVAPRGKTGRADAQLAAMNVQGRGARCVFF